MDNFFTIYLLSIVDGLGSALAGAGGIVGFISLIVLVILHLVRLARAAERQSYRDSNDNEHVAKAFDSFIKLSKTTTIVGLIVFSLGYLMPNRRALVEAYVIVEGSKLVTAENTEKMGEAIAARFDKVLSIIEGKAVDKVEEVADSAKETTEAVKEAVKDDSKKTE